MGESSGKPDYLQRLLADAQAKEGQPTPPPQTVEQRLTEQAKDATGFARRTLEGALKTEQDLAAARAKLASEQSNTEPTPAQDLRDRLVTPSKPNAGLGMGISDIGNR